MNIMTGLKQAAKKLQPKHIICAEEGNLGLFEAELLLAHVLGKDRAWLLAHDDEVISPAKARRFEALVKRRAGHEPIAYILGAKEFYGRVFNVNQGVLIPRPDTELLIDAALNEIEKNSRDAVIWDVGTGSGAIAVTLGCERPLADVLATDVNVRALAVAKKNAKAHKAKISFLKSDLLQKTSYAWLKKRGSSRSHLIICANLPYLPTSDKKKIAKDVIQFEPTKALFSGKEGNDLILRFMGQLSRHLQEWDYGKVALLFEFDPPQSKALRDAARKLFPKAEIEIRKDLAGRERMLVASLQ